MKGREEKKGEEKKIEEGLQKRIRRMCFDECLIERLSYEQELRQRLWTQQALE